MAFSQGQLDALDAAIAGGTLTVSYEGKSVTYRSLGEMVRLRRLIADSLAAGAGQAPAPAHYASYSRE